MGKQTVAVYFYDYTSQVNSFYLNHATSSESVNTLHMANSVQETIGASVMLLDSRNTMDQEMMLTMIKSRLGILKANVEGYIDWKMIQMNKFEQEFFEFSPSEIIQQVIDEYTKCLANKQTKLIFDANASGALNNSRSGFEI